ncbi:MAG: hypothetical protein B5766_03480 [Candidatus Lumbricidophila eiseniae]|uniref:Uncharacterized protein n=1 Tax=Candidatus Lumbricidiphila eiseniae TaxID=1969409 RepID=A0A2A6FSU1_9MICO|nr:MAG: hypothetical protein B5766_03480 [Candidatus Lumbricidophila eiseniae]
MIVRQIIFAIVTTGTLFLIVKIAKNLDYWLGIIGISLLGACVVIPLHYFMFVPKVKRLPKDIQARFWWTHYIKIYGMITVGSVAMMLAGELWPGLYVMVCACLNILRQRAIYRNHCREQLK